MGWRDWLRLPRIQTTLPTELSGSRRRGIPLLWDLAAKGIYPAVRSGKAFAPVVRRSWVADLSLVLLYDFGPRMIQVSEATAEVWGQSHEALWERALRNLRALPRPHWEDLNDGVFCIVSDCAYEETFPLIDEVMDSLPCKDPVVAIPNRGVMLAAPGSDPDHLRALIARARDSLHNAPWPLSGTLLQRIAGGWSPFVPPPSLRAGV
jgi:hypothetical protein